MRMWCDPYDSLRRSVRDQGREEIQLRFVTLQGDRCVDTESIVNQWVDLLTLSFYR